jgi:hypothetical protein
MFHHSSRRQQSTHGCNAQWNFVALSLTVCDNNGVELFDASFPDMHLVPEAPYNIISLTQRLENDWTLSGDKLRGLTLSKDGNEIRFDIRIETAKGVLWAACMKRKTVELNATAVSLSIKQAHLRLGHMNEEATRKTSKALVEVNCWSIGPM